LEHLRRKKWHQRNFNQRSAQGSQRGGAPNRGRGHGRGPYTLRPLYCMYHGSTTNHRIKDCPIYLEMKKKMKQDSTQPSHQSTLREVNHARQWAPHHKQYSPSYPSHFSPQVYHNNQTQPLAYYQSYNYATTNHPQPSPAPQIIYPSSVPQITYPMPNTTTPQVKTETDPPCPPQIQEPPQQTNTFPTHGTILIITIGSNTDFDTKRHHRNYYRQVNHVVVEGPITQTKWSHMSITFSFQDLKLTSFPHTDIMVVTVHIDRWDVTKILVYNGSQAEILFLAAFDKMGFDRKQLKESTKSLYGFGKKRIESVGVITLPVSFGSPKNPRTEFITFDVVDMIYPYNAIFGRGLLNTFEAALHLAYLCLKIPGTFGVISIFSSQQEARNIKKGFMSGHKIIHFLREDQKQYTTFADQHKAEAPAECKKAREPKGEIKKVPLDPKSPR
jgi:hypothetical protein